MGRGGRKDTMGRVTGGRMLTAEKGVEGDIVRAEGEDDHGEGEDEEVD